METYLFTLWKTCRDGHYTIQHLADTVHLSPKQFKRYLKRWQDDGWLDYTSGQGRGHLSELVWLRHVERELARQLLERIDRESIDAVTEQLSWDWSPAQTGRFMRRLEQKFGYVQTASDALLIPRKRPFLTAHPLEAADIHSAHLVQNVFNRLFWIDEDGLLKGELAHHYAWQGNTLSLYLRKDVRFHDGSLMTSKDVTKSLRALIAFPAYAWSYRHIEQIKSNGPYRVDLILDQQRNSLLPKLATLHTSIHKEGVGTGPFQLTQQDDKKTVLQAFANFFGVRALLDRIEFIQMPDAYDPVYRTSLSETGETGTISTQSGFGLIFLNPRPGGVFESAEARHYIHRLIASVRPFISQCNERSQPNVRGFLGEFSQEYIVPDGPPVTFDRPIRIKLTDFTENVTYWLCEMFDRQHIPYEFVPVGFKESITNLHAFADIDLAIHAEVFERNLTVAFHQFLTNEYSPPAKLYRQMPEMDRRIQQYDDTTFEDWMPLHQSFERYVIDASYFIPLFDDTRLIPYPIELQNLVIDSFGYLDFSKLWIPT
ncbi:ABC transporter substrate-binding protein (plasmid) [Exiguobacterium sp. N4-1P]|uniref:ABC transporter substrate-binding protein n=1 Tax=Exiguobacterium sp. N4-1P TaxID=2051906 RepID=UPI000B593981|nr:ABC transporter substrate-binding protein [Exiguobacterium sp. N4-1P]ASI35287.1 ABC transporter substrate-binding protein [Exiguobacterium sp. N4-1P]ASI37300.1 ABC transporter substrate-binding protein [Exiguobacterium sp. N4-1P]